jgi:hypothetical protein
VPVRAWGFKSPLAHQTKGRPFQGRPFVGSVRCRLVTTKRLTPRAAEEIARKVAALVHDDYVFPDQAVEIAKLVVDHASKGEYASLSEASDLAAALTADLQSVNGDRHLRVLYSDESLVDLADPQAELAMWSERADREAGGTARRKCRPGRDSTRAVSGCFGW